MKATPIAAMAALACAVSAAYANPVAEAGVSEAVFNFNALPLGSAVLFDQTDNASGNGAPVQNFEASLDGYDAQGADDFEFASPNGWTIEQLNFVITQGAGGTAASVDVAIHENVAGGGNPDLPGAAVCAYAGVAPGQTGAPPSALNVVLPTPCIIPEGRYWVSLIINQDFATDGQVFWSNRTTQTFSEAVWVNPGDGFGTGCTTFTPMTTCNVGGGVNPDFLFQIVGVVGGIQPLPEPRAVPVSSVVGLGLLGGLLALLGVTALRRRF